MPLRRGRRKEPARPAEVTSTRNSTRPAGPACSRRGRVASAISGAAQQVHVHEQRATAHDLQQLPGSTDGAGIPPTSTQTPPGAAASCERGHRPLATAMHETDDRCARHKSAGRYRGSLHGGHDYAS